MITCYTVSEIWCVTDVIVIFQFSFSFSVIVIVIFFPFYPPNSPKNQNLKKMKKTPRDIIILHMCTKNYDVRFLRYGARQMDRWMDRQTDR